MAIRMVLRKIMHNKGLMASLLAGMLLAGALVALIPTYARMSLNRTLQKELEAYQQTSGIYPGMALVSAFYNENEALDILRELELKKQPAFSDGRIASLLSKRRDSIASLDAQFEGLDKSLGLDAQLSVINLASTAMQITTEKHVRNVIKTGRLQALTGLDQNITLLRGALPNPPVDGLHQVLATEEALVFFGAEVGDTVACVPRLDQTYAPIMVKIVGTWDVNPEKPLAWGFFKPVMFKESLLLRTEDAKALLLGTPALAASVRSYAAYDYRQMLMSGLETYLEDAKKINRQLKPFGAAFEMPVLEKVSVFAAKEKTLKTTLWILNIPVLLILILYMAMVSGMVIDSDEGEISLLVSRGAGRGLVFFTYLLLGLSLSLGALALGPPLSQVLCRMLGTVSGFLSFARRGVPSVPLDLESYLYCAAALLISVFLLAIPAARRHKVSVVSLKRSRTTAEKQPLWLRLGLDILLLAFSVAAWYLIKTRPEWLASVSGELNPIIFALMPCFAVGAILCFLRTYPFVVRLLSRLGTRFQSAGTYLALSRVSRNFRNYRYIMMFLSLTMAVGIFSASAARTLNDNETNRLAYSLGADVVLSVNWPRKGAQNAYVNYAAQAAQETALPGTRRYQEPSFTPFRGLTGVESAARVFEKSAVQVVGVKSAGNVHLMAIDPADFGRTAWYRSDLWSTHFYAYLNALSMNERACLISSSLSKKLSAQMGDLITVNWEGSDTASFLVAGVVKYWPGWNPYPSVAGDTEPLLLVADLNAVQSLLAVEPYNVWLKLSPDADTQALYGDTNEKGIRPTSLRNFRQENITLTNGSSRIAVNGVMSVGFISSCLICFLGFILYWQMYLRKNQLQFGLQRGMGFTVGQLMKMLLTEQLLTSLVALISGVTTGIAGSLMFVPLFEKAQNISQAPPFHVMIKSSDRFVIYAIIGSMLIICWCYLIIKMKRMKVAQAIKLGED